MSKRVLTQKKNRLTVRLETARKRLSEAMDYVEVSRSRENQVELKAARELVSTLSAELADTQKKIDRYEAIKARIAEIRKKTNARKADYKKNVTAFKEKQAEALAVDLEKALASFERKWRAERNLDDREAVKEFEQAERDRIAAAEASAQNQIEKLEQDLKAALEKDPASPPRRPRRRTSNP